MREFRYNLFMYLLRTAAFCIALVLVVPLLPVSAASTSSSSSSASNCKEPKILDCMLGYRPKCVSGKWKCLKRSGGTGKAPVLTAIKPDHAWFGKDVVIFGTGFAKKNNFIHIGDYTIPHVGSANGKSLTFRIPRIIKPACLFKKPTCEYGVAKLDKGMYNLSVETEGKVSEPMTLWVVER